MKKNIFLTFLFTTMLCINFTFALEINQVYVNPINSENGGEAIEIYNPSNFTINISNLIIKTKTSNNDATISENTLMLPKTYFLIADSGWDTNKDNNSWRNADYEESLSLSNSNSGVAIILNNNVIDSVGWGDSNIINDSDLYESNTTLNPDEGFVLLRTQDTDNNLNDFVITFPNFTVIENQNNNSNNSNNSNNNQGNETDYSIIEEYNLSNTNTTLSLTINVTNSKPEILHIILEDDDNFTNGVQITPNPNNERNINFEVIIKDSNGVEDIRNVIFKFTIENETITKNLTKLQDLDTTSSIYVGNLSMYYWNKPDYYNLSVYVEDSQNLTSEINESFIYLPLVSLLIDSNNLEISGSSGNVVSIHGDNDTTTQMPTLKNTGNIDLSIGIFGDNLVNGEGHINASSINYTISNYTNTLSNFITNTGIKLQARNNSLLPFGLDILIPDFVYEGTYQGIIYLLGIVE